MKFEQFQFEGREVRFESLRHAAESAGFIHAGQWDYERVTFDLKIVHQEDIYYLRVPAYAIKGDIPHDDCVVRMLTPILGKHYYPHGVEYDGEDFPEPIVNRCTKKLEQIKANLDSE
ncbi:YugN family protein [Halalkalibacterium halodurans]|uniref:BH2606 protein n=1 Tax=Halalkalibacterium halodurans (strain ATCC BAA-125 / DSM 18197 / FERM 7344 / JCM 9153 / C-125) TaxID=272558 RepID=Q9K9N9_HALH5|nr:YugN family protein [Halalkalibacterium halodurans]MDY7223142.1 YugN family protein [Halalkalibacterium halodurans]MDY7242363.1 YugN family protein [Halalkalibacterium halodurans]MED3647874.1 YugN family protein [Halalkalibacterium halodurans]MED4079750.1 YugN family protein [Halalkalibacterium halodurans]MED4086308.1 YugN family protein [Halalkalibacterium halodurans]